MLLLLNRKKSSDSFAGSSIYLNCMFLSGAAQKNVYPYWHPTAVRLLVLKQRAMAQCQFGRAPRSVFQRATFFIKAIWSCD